MLELIGIIIFALCVAFTFNEGLWGAAILFCNVLMAAVLATNFFEPVANWLESMLSGYTYWCDFVAVWLCFALFVVILRLVSDYFASRHRVRFKKPLDVGGGLFFAGWIGWLMVQFTFFTLHLAPLERNPMGFQEKPETRNFFGLGPDRNWIAFVHNLSKNGSLNRTPPQSDPNAYVFDPQGDFILKYGSRRKAFEAEPGLGVR
jgi:hypothetical protein